MVQSQRREGTVACAAKTKASGMTSTRIVAK